LKNLSRFISLSLLCLFIGLSVSLTASPALADSASPATYTVRAGDFLGLIAHKFGVSISDLRSANNLSSDVLQIGQKIRITNPFRLIKDIKVEWTAPCRKLGEVLHPFGPYKKKGILMPSTGVDVACPVGTEVAAPADGVVRHVGPMDGFGILIIIEHGGGYATVFAPFDPTTIIVETGQAVLGGDHLGRTGPPPDRDTPPYLHLELRKGDKALQPDPLLK